MKTFYALISIGMLVIHCQAMDVSSAVAEPTNASVLFRALMDANTSTALTNVLLQYHALPPERQNEMLVYVIFKMGSHEKLLIEEAAKQDPQDLSVVCGRCAWFAGRVLNLQLPSVNSQTPRKEIAETREAIFKAMSARREKAVPTIEKFAQVPLAKRLALAQTNSTAPSLLSVLAEDADVTVRRAVAANINTPSSALAKLAFSDGNAEVRKTALENIKTVRTAIPRGWRRK